MRMKTRKGRSKGREEGTRQKRRRFKKKKKKGRKEGRRKIGKAGTKWGINDGKDGREVNEGPKERREEIKAERK